MLTLQPAFAQFLIAGSVLFVLVEVVVVAYVFWRRNTEPAPSHGERSTFIRRPERDEAA